MQAPHRRYLTGAPLTLPGANACVGSSWLTQRNADHCPPFAAVKQNAVAGCRSLKQAHRDRAAYLQADSDPLLVRSTASMQPSLTLGALQCLSCCMSY